LLSANKSSCCSTTKEVVWKLFLTGVGELIFNLLQEKKPEEFWVKLTTSNGCMS